MTRSASDKPKIEKPKVDLFKVLPKLNSADLSYWQSLNVDEKKTLAPVVVMRWLSCVKDKKQVVHLNHLVNSLVFNMYHHSELLFKLMMASCTDGTKRYQWLKKNTILKKKPLQLGIIKRFYKCSLLEAKEYIQGHSFDDIVEMAQDLGEDNDLIDKLRKENV